MPLYHRRKGWSRIAKSGLEKSPKQSEMPDNFIDLMTLKIAIRHRMKMYLDFFPEIFGHLLGNSFLQVISFNSPFGEVLSAVVQITRRGMMKMPDQCFLPIRPILATRSLPICEGQ